MNDSERAYARKLLEMINSVDAEGSKVMDDLRNEAFKEIVNSLMKQKNSSHRTYVKLGRLTGLGRGLIQKLYNRKNKVMEYSKLMSNNLSPVTCGYERRFDT